MGVDFGKGQGGQWCVFGGFQYDCIVCRQCGCDFLCQYQQWKILWYDLVVDVKGYMVGKFGFGDFGLVSVVIEMLYDQWYVDVVVFVDWFVVIQCFQYRQEVFVFLDGVGDGIQKLCLVMVWYCVLVVLCLVCCVYCFGYVVCCVL